MNIKMFLLSALIFPQIVMAGDLYVSLSTGSDSNSGSASAPLKSLQKAASLVSAGTIVHVAAGTYTGNVSTSKSGTASARIRYISDVKWGAKIIGTGTEATWNNNGHYVDIVGFDISGSGRIGILNNASFAIIANNHVHDMKVSGGCTGSGGAGIVNANYSGSDNDIINNLVHDIGTPGACIGVQGIYHANLRGHIYNNIVYRVSAFGIHLWHAANAVTVMNNTSFANGSSSMGGGIVVGSGDAPGGIVVNNTTVSNNIVYNNPRAGIIEYCYSGVNCIGSTNKYENNLVYGNGSAISLRVGSAVGTIVADPRFVNYKFDSSGDFHLQSTSPAIDRGVSSLAPSTDMGGNARPQGNGIDIGAYEFLVAGSGSPGTPAPTPSPEEPTPAPAPGPAPVARASTLSLRFASQKVGRKSGVQYVILKNAGTAKLVIPSAFVITGDFTFGGLGTCRVGYAYAPGASCTASVVFKPRAVGLRTGSLTMKTNASSTPIVVRLSGTGR